MHLFKSILKCNFPVMRSCIFFSEENDLQKSFSYTAQETFLIIIMLKTVVLLHVFMILWPFLGERSLIRVNSLCACNEMNSSHVIGVQVSVWNRGSQRSITCVSIHFLSFSSVLSHTDKVKPENPLSVLNDCMFISVTILYQSHSGWNVKS